jgi:hypothetical protein
MGIPSLVDHAVPILSAASELDDTQRADLHDVYHNSRDPEELARLLQSVPVPDAIKHKLYDAKKQSMPPVDPVEKAIAVVNRIGNLSPKTLELAKKYPKTVSALIGLINKKNPRSEPESDEE